MSTQHDLTPIVRSWLRKTAMPLSDDVREWVLERLPATHQRRAGWPARRFPDMVSTTRLVIAAAAVVAVVMAALLLPRSDGGIGGPGPTASPSPQNLQPSVSPTSLPTEPSNSDPGPTDSPTSSASPAPSPSAAQFAAHYMVMSPGRYVMPEPNTDGVGRWPVDRVIVTVPDGWTQWGPWRGGGIVKGGPSPEVATARLTFGRLGSLDPGPPRCSPPETLPGQTVDDLTTSLQAITDVEVADLAIERYVGKRVDFTIAAASPECRRLFGWSTPSGGERWNYSWDPGWHHQLSILNIDGVRFLIDASYRLDASPEVRAELQAIVDSIELE